MPNQMISELFHDTGRAGDGNGNGGGGVGGRRKKK